MKIKLIRQKEFDEERKIAGHMVGKYYEKKGIIER